MKSVSSLEHVSRTDRNYARIAKAYRFLEYIAFGRSLEAARTCFLGHLTACNVVGVFGAGDGRCFDSLLLANPEARFVSVDSDATMTSLAQARVARLGGSERVQFQCEDVRSLRWPVNHFDAVVTQFFLDCFGVDDLQQVIVAIARGLAPTGPWLFADFAIPGKTGPSPLEGATLDCCSLHLLSLASGSRPSFAAANGTPVATKWFCLRGGAFPHRRIDPKCRVPPSAIKSAI